MTRIFSIFAASALAVLPISAFAQQDATPARAATPNTAATSMAPSPAAPGGNKATVENAAKPVSKVSPAAKPDMQTTGGKTNVHGMNIVKSHNGRTDAPATMKSAEPSKS